MTLIINAVATIVLGGLGWIALEFIGRPVRSFFDLRRRTKALMLDCIDMPSVLFDYAGEGEKYNDDKEALKKLANEMIAFGQSETLAVLFVKCWVSIHFGGKKRCDTGGTAAQTQRTSHRKL